MTASDRLLKQNQSNFLLSNFREFYKLWRDNQEAILTVKCCDGKLSINFESSFQSPETKPILQTFEKRKVKRISPSRRRRNQARAERFRNKFKETPAPSKEGQEEMQVSVSESTPAGKGPPDPAKSQENAASQACPLLFSVTQFGKDPPDQTIDAENSPQVSRVKRKAKRRQDKRKNATVNEKPEAKVETSEMSAAHVEAQVLEPHHGSEELTPPTRMQWTQENVEWLLDELEKRIKDEDQDDHNLCGDLDRTLRLIKNFGNGTRNFREGKGDEGQRILASFERKIQYLVGKFHRTEQPRARASSVSSYKGRTSAKSQKGKKR